MEITHATFLDAKIICSSVTRLFDTNIYEHVHFTERSDFNQTNSTTDLLKTAPEQTKNISIELKNYST